MAFTFNDTKLINDDKVRAAFNYTNSIEMPLPMDGDDFMRAAVKAGEIISVAAKNPDPDVVAALVIMGGMVFRYQTNGLAADIGQNAVDYINLFIDSDLDDQSVIASMNEPMQLMLFANCLKGLSDTQNEIDAGGWDYKKIKKELQGYGTTLDVLLPITSETALASMALEQYATANAALENLVRNRQSPFDFDKLGLPDHPLIRSVYEHVKAHELNDDHPYGQRFSLVINAAKALVDTGATQDPELIAAALMGQFYVRKPDDIEAQFTPRLRDLYLETSAFAAVSRLVAGQENPIPSAESILLKSNMRLALVEEMIASYKEYAEQNPSHLHQRLEMLEKQSDILADNSAQMPCRKLADRMQQAVIAAHNLIQQPENVRIRKPGSPPAPSNLHG